MSLWSFLTENVILKTMMMMRASIAGADDEYVRSESVWWNHFSKGVNWAAEARMINVDKYFCVFFSW